MAESTATAAAPKTDVAKSTKVSPEALAAKVAEVEETASKLGTAKHFDQPGVRFSIPELRNLELSRKDQLGQSFRQHVEEALLYYYLNPQNEWDKKNAPAKDQLNKWLEQVRSGAKMGGGAAAAAVAREEALRKELAEMKLKYEAAIAAKASK